jgi:hypothetical protein
VCNPSISHYASSLYKILSVKHHASLET